MMAKKLIVTFILWVVVITAVSTGTTAEPTTTGSAPTTAPTTQPATSGQSTTAPTTQPTTSGQSTTAPTTGSPSSSSTPAPPTSQTPPTAGSTDSPNTGSSSMNTASQPSTSQATTEPPSACISNPCSGGSTCEDRADQKFECLCLTGDVYANGACQRAKVFPGQLQLELAYETGMDNKKSQIFTIAAKKITAEIDDKFKGKAGYKDSLVLELRERKQSQVRAKAETGKVDASVQIIYEANADVTGNFVEEEMKSACSCDDCPLKGVYKSETLCSDSICDKTTTECKSENGAFTCTCKEGYITSDLTDRLCLACPPGEKYDDTNTCVKCDFGYSGLNCKDDRLFVAVVVSAVLGGVMLIVLIALSVVTAKSKKNGSKIKDQDFGKPYQSHSIAKAPLSNSNGHSTSIKEPANTLANLQAPKIPRATTGNNWDSRTNLEMTPSNSRQNLISSGRNSRFNDNQDDMYSFSQGRPKNNPYEQVQSRSNPYTQNQATNPYAQGRGQTNPYYN